MSQQFTTPNEFSELVWSIACENEDRFFGGSMAEAFDGAISIATAILFGEAKTLAEMETWRGNPGPITIVKGTLTP